MLCLSTITVHVDSDNYALFSCPFCGNAKRISVEKFKHKNHSVSTRCECKRLFKSQLNFRRFYRKSVALSGEIMSLSSNDSVWRKMNVCDLSMSGLRFRMLESVFIEKGDKLRIKFNLEMKKSPLVDKEVVVRFVNGDTFGCEFINLALEEKELGFFLFSQ